MNRIFRDFMLSVQEFQSQNAEGIPVPVTYTVLW